MNSRRRLLLRLAQAVVTIGLLVLVWRVMDGSDAARVLLTADPRWLLAALLALTAHTLLAAERWRVTARALGIVITLRHAWREYYLSQLVNQTLPGGVVGDAGRAVRSRGQAGLSIAAQTVIVERVAGQIAVLVVMDVAFAITAAVPEGPEWPSWLLMTVVAMTAVGLLGLGLVLVAGKLPGRVGKLMTDFTSAAAIALVGRPVILRQVVLSTGTTACILAAFALCARSVGLNLPVAAVVTLVPLILLTMLVPITVSGWGLREGAAATLLPLVGATASASLAASVAFGIIGLLTVVPGVVILWRQSQGHPK